MELLQKRLIDDFIHTHNSLASALRCLASYQLEDAMEVRMQMLKADKRAWNGRKGCVQVFQMLGHVSDLHTA